MLVARLHFDIMTPKMALKFELQFLERNIMSPVLQIIWKDMYACNILKTNQQWSFINLYHVIIVLFNSLITDQNVKQTNFIKINCRSFLIGAWSNLPTHWTITYFGQKKSLSVILLVLKIKFLVNHTGYGNFDLCSD